MTQDERVALLATVAATVLTTTTTNAGGEERRIQIAADMAEKIIKDAEQRVRSSPPGSSGHWGGGEERSFRLGPD